MEKVHIVEAQPVSPEVGSKTCDHRPQEIRVMKRFVVWVIHPIKVGKDIQASPRLPLIIDEGKSQIAVSPFIRSDGGDHFDVFLEAGIVEPNYQAVNHCRTAFLLDVCENSVICRMAGVAL